VYLHVLGRGSDSRMRLNTQTAGFSHPPWSLATLHGHGYVRTFIAK
jgi:hypothetical protein